MSGRDVDTAELAGRFQLKATDWTLPAATRKVGANLVCRQRGGMGAEPPLRGELEPDLLERFLALADTDDDAIVAFADEVGGLRLCARHRRSTYHRGDDPCPIEHVGDGYAVPFDGWRATAADLRSILRLADELAVGRPGARDDWFRCLVIQSWRRWPGTDETRRAVARPDAPIDTNTLASLRRLLERVVNERLTDARVRLQNDWSDPTPSTVLAFDGLYGALVVQLQFRLARHRRVAICAGCFEPFEPDVHANRGERVYCTKPECKKARSRDATRRWRAGETKPTKKGAKAT
jgi:hypothetical protein